jgi:hypothetical protein
MVASCELYGCLPFVFQVRPRYSFTVSAQLHLQAARARGDDDTLISFRPLTLIHRHEAMGTCRQVQIMSCLAPDCNGQQGTREPKGRSVLGKLGQFS